MTDLHWVKCPKCGDTSDLHRIGQPLRVRTKRLRGAAPLWNAQVLTQSISTQIRCSYCGTIFHSTEPTRQEAFGYDGVGDTSY